MFEPAPFDFGIIAMFTLTMLFGLRVPRSIGGTVIILIVFMLFSMIGTSQSPASTYFNDTLRHIQITGLLVGVSIFIACFLYRHQDRAVNALMNGWLVAALIASTAGILGYFDALGPLSEQFTLHSRAKGTFKDPNVLAPFLVAPALYCVYHAATRSAAWCVINLAMLLVLVLGIFLSFSRGGWGHFALSGLVAATLWLVTVADQRFKTRLVGFTILAGIVLTLALFYLLAQEGVAELLAHRFKIQEYDSSGYGRFAGQFLTFLKVLEHPLGMGAHGFLPDWYEQPHNVYLFQFMIAGWAGGFTYLVIVIFTLVRAFAFLRQPNRHTGIMVVLFASFLGVALEGIIVDSDHWRHFWVLLGAIWGLVAIHTPAPIRAKAVPVGVPLPHDPGPRSPVAGTARPSATVARSKEPAASRPHLRGTLG